MAASKVPRPFAGLRRPGCSRGHRCRWYVDASRLLWSVTRRSRTNFAHVILCALRAMRGRFNGGPTLQCRGVSIGSSRTASWYSRIALSSLPLFVPDDTEVPVRLGILGSSLIASRYFAIASSSLPRWSRTSPRPVCGWASFGSSRIARQAPCFSSRFDHVKRLGFHGRPWKLSSA
jgi:hypothetical protein